jgi:outer membrane lipoprotein-sorting protein
MEYSGNSRAIRYLVVTGVLGAFLAGSALGQSEPADPNNLPADHPFVKEGRVDLDAVVEYFEDLYRSDSSISVARLTVTKPRSKRTLEMKIWTRGEDKALIVIRQPARERGTATLKVDKNLWNYLPRIKRTIRIPPSMMLASWMGSDFTNDDLVKESSYSKDYRYELVGPSEQPKGWLVKFTAKPDIVGLWNRFELILSEDAQVPIEAKYYDRKDRLARVLHWSDVKVFDGKRIPSRMTLTPADKEGHVTEMVYLDIDFDVTVPDVTFSLSNLEQRR